MRIFQVIEPSSNTAVPANRAWLRLLHEPLLDLGHDVHLVSASEGRTAMRRRSRRRRERFSERLLAEFQREHARRPFHLFFAYLMDGVVEPGAIDEIRRAGVLACNFSCNNAHQFELVRELSPHFDVNLHAEKGATEKFAAIGAAPLWWPMASNPKYFRPHDLPRTIEASFVGTNYALRARYVKRLLDAKIDVHAYGPAWTGGARSPLRSAAKRALLQLRAMTARRGAAQTRASALLAEHEFRRLLAR